MDIVANRETHRKTLEDVVILRLVFCLLIILYHALCPYGIWEPITGIEYVNAYKQLLVVKKGHSEKARYLCDKKEQRCTAVKSWRSSTSITRPNGCREGCQSRHTVHGTTFRTRYLTDGSGTYTGEWFRWRLQGYRKDRRKKVRNRLSRGRRIRAAGKSASGSISSRVQG